MHVEAAAHDPAETLAHIQCVPSTGGCAHSSTPHSGRHGLQLGQGSERGMGREGDGAVHRELTVAGLHGIPVREDAMADWHRMCDDLTDGDMAPEIDADPAMGVGMMGLRYPGESARRMGCALGPAHGLDPRIYTVQRLPPGLA